MWAHGDDSGLVSEWGLLAFPWLSFGRDGNVFSIDNGLLRLDHRQSLFFCCGVWLLGTRRLDVHG